jgi:AcrR family transcriptional regulator
MDIELQLEPPELALRQLAETLIKKMESDRQFLRFLRLVVGESERFPELAQMFIRNFAQIVIERLTSYLASRPELNLPDPEATARIFLGAILYVIVTQELLHGKEIIPIHRDRIVDGLMHLILGSKNHG